MPGESPLRPRPQECCLPHHKFVDLVLVRQRPTSVLLAGLKRRNLPSADVPKPCWDFPVASQHGSSSAHTSLQQDKRNPGGRCCRGTGCSVLSRQHHGALLSFHPARKLTGERWRGETEEKVQPFPCPFFCPPWVAASTPTVPAKASPLVGWVDFEEVTLLNLVSSPQQVFSTARNSNALSSLPTLEFFFQQS